MMAFVAVKRALHNASYGVDPGIFPVLHHLAITGEQRQGQIAEAIGLDASTISRHVRTLQSEGLIESMRDPADRRAWVVTISPAGRDFLNRHLDRNRRVFAQATADFTDQQRRELIELLTKLASNITASQGVTQ